MINLLGRVRKEHLKDANYRIYATYAMGEVVLVMAGLLLTLKVDNWMVDPGLDVTARC